MMRTFFLLLCVSLIGAGCARDSDALHRLEEGQAQQLRLLEEQNALLQEHSATLAKQAKEQQQVLDALAGLDRNFNGLRKRVLSKGSRPAARPAQDARLVLSEEGKLVVGRNELVWLDLLARTLNARIDTGAGSSSLNAVELQPFERDGKEWIRFRVPDEGHPDGGEVYETALLRHVRIRQASAEELERRPVVRLKVRVGKLVEEIEFNLTNRENMLYPVLLGRNFLRDIAVVDVARKFVQPQYVPEQTDAAE